MANKKIWKNKSQSFDEAKKFDIYYYLRISPEERIETMQFLREEYFNMRGDLKNESRKGLRRTAKIIKQT